MVKWISDDVLDAALDEIALGNIMTLCSAQPTTRTEAVTTYALADIALTPGDGNGDFTIANGDTSGRKVTVTAQSAVDVDANGTGTHVAICDATRLLLVTTCNSVAVTTADQVNFPAFDAEIADPS